MASATPLKQPFKVGWLMRRRLRELKRTPRELAAAVQFSETYIADLLAGRRRPPAPGRTDVYDRMTKFLRLHRNDLPTCARAERESLGSRRRRLHPTVRRALLDVCQPVKARALARPVANDRGPALELLIPSRLLEVAQA